jgi:predicted  nucleic acid-binding Zn-ribbon protein
MSDEDPVSEQITKLTEEVRNLQTRVEALNEAVSRHEANIVVLKQRTGLLD